MAEFHSSSTPDMDALMTKEGDAYQRAGYKLPTLNDGLDDDERLQAQGEHITTNPDVVYGVPTTDVHKSIPGSANIVKWASKSKGE